MDSKIDLRTKAKLIRNGLDIKNISKTLCQKVRENELFQSSKHIMLFYPLKNEIDTLELLNEEKNFYLPRMKGLTLDVCPYKKGDKLLTQKFNIKEPLTQPIDPKILDLIIIPALMVDKNNHRLGYGKGYYDRLITKTNAKTIVLIPKELIISNLPIEKHDKKVDLIITD